jgi:hypothetical protein
MNKFGQLLNYLKGLGSSGSQFGLPSDPSTFTFSPDQIKKAPGAGFYNSNMGIGEDNSFSSFRLGGNKDGGKTDGGKTDGGKTDGGKKPGDDGTYGGFTREDIESIQQKGFDQQNKLFQQGLAMGGIDKIAAGIKAGPEAYVNKVVPLMFAGNAALLSAGAADNRSLAGVMGQPYKQLQLMRFFS